MIFRYNQIGSHYLWIFNTEASELIISDFVCEASAFFYSCCFYVTQIDLLWEADLKVFCFLYLTQHVVTSYAIASDWFTTASALCNVMLIKN